MGHNKMPVFDSIWAFPDCKSKSNALHDGYGMTHKAERGMEEGPCCFSRPLVQFQGHIDQTSSLGRSQLSNPSDLPCWFMIALWRHIHEYCVHDLGRRIGTRLLPGPMLIHDQFEQTLLYPPLQRSWKGGILVSPCPSVRLSVCGQNRVRSVSSTILIGSISYLHILSSNFRRCVACNARFKIKKKLKFGEFFKFVTLTLSSFHVGSNMTQWYG